MKRRKRTCAVLLAVLCLCGAAQAVEAFTTYKNAANGYQIDYPSDWQLLDRDSIDDALGYAVSGGLSGIDADAAAQYRAQIEQLDMAVCIAPDGSTNLTVVYATLPQALTNDEAIVSLCPAINEQLKAVFENIEPIETGALVTFDEREFVYAAFAIVANGVDMVTAQFYCFEGTTMYTLTFTVFPAYIEDGDALNALTDEIMASFIPAQ